MKFVRWWASLVGGARRQRHATDLAVPAEAAESTEATSFLWASFYYDEVKAERDRRASLEQRGLGVISLSGVLIALLLNASRDISTSQWPAASAVLLLVGLASLTVGAICGLSCAVPLNYAGMHEERLEAILGDDWNSPDAEAGLDIAANHVLVIQRSLKMNLVKVRFLRAAIAAVAVAILSASSALTVIIFDHIA